MIQRKALLTNKKPSKKSIILIYIISVALLVFVTGVVMMAGVVSLYRQINKPLPVNNSQQAGIRLQTTAAAAAPAVSPSLFIDSFTAAKLPVSKAEEYTKETDPNGYLGRPNKYIQKISWSDSRLGLDIGLLDAGTIEVFDTVEDARARYNYVVRMTKNLPLVQTYNYLDGLYFMRLSREFTPGQAEDYEMLFNRMLHDDAANGTPVATPESIK